MINNKGLMKKGKCWYDWRKKVYVRDGYKCVLCGRKNLRVDPHHILPIRDYPELKYRVSNGATLCRRDHRKTFRKEYKYIKRIVNKIFGGMEKWIYRHLVH